MQEVLIAVDGCDDSTSVVMEVSEAELAFLQKLAEKIKEASTYICMPRMRVEKL